MISNNLKDFDITDNSYIPHCKEIYNYIFKVIDYLIVENGGLEVSHYTGRETVEKLIFEKSRFRMCSMATANDTSEGRIIFELLGHPEWYNKLIGKNEHQCFFASFTFDSNCLNHFRLYGKVNEKEATGVSMCFNSGSFDCSMSHQLDFITYKEFCEKYITLPLFRTLYVYPKDSYITSIGHVEYLELNEELNEEEKKERDDIMECEKKIAKEIPEKIKSEIDKLKESINLFINIDKDIKSVEKRIDIVSQILLNLSYIVKHAAFKEEQECRLFTIQKLRGTEHIHFCDKSRKMYVEYQLPVNEIKRITFAPKTSEYLLFKDRLEWKKEKLQKENSTIMRCIQSKLPIA
jgi:hypothetical protein